MTMKFANSASFLVRNFVVIWEAPIRKGRTWAIAVRRGSYKSLFLLNSGRFFPRKIGKFTSELWFA